MLAAHSAFDCGPETHCLSRWSRLARSERARILDPADWPRRATAFVTSLSLGKQPVHPMFGLTVEDVRTWLAARPPSLAALLESLTAQRATRDGAPRWVEKTPRHLEVPELIVETWPGARIVRIVRDPRDAAVSLTRVPFGTPSLLTNLSVLARMNEAAADFYRESRQALTVRYEDLVAEPEQELRRVCDFVGEDYEPGMLEDRSGATGVAAAHEWWKGDATGPIDRSRSAAGPRRCRRRCSATPRSTWATCSRSTATAPACRRPGSWPSCRPATPSTLATTTSCCGCRRPAWPSGGPCRPASSSCTSRSRSSSSAWSASWTPTAAGQPAGGSWPSPDSGCCC